MEHVVIVRGPGSVGVYHTDRHCSRIREASRISLVKLTFALAGGDHPCLECHRKVPT